MSLIENFLEKCTEFDNNISYRYLVDGENNVKNITYRELKESAEKFAGFLLEKYQPQSRVLLLFDTSLDFIISFWGTIIAGMVAVPVQPPFNFKMLERLLHIGKNADSNILITSHDFLQQLDSFKSYFEQLPAMEKFSVTQILNENKKYEIPNISNDFNALIQYTSGSVGNSKGVLLSHNNMLSNVKMPIAVLTKIKPEKTEKDSCLTWLPLYHDMGLISGILMPVFMGIESVVMSPLMFLQKPFRWIKALSDYKSSVSAAPNFAYDLCVKKVKDEQLEGLDISNWSIALNGAESVRYDTIENFSNKFSKAGFRKKQFYPAYGLAESVVFVTGKSRNEDVRFLQLDKTALEKNKVVLSDVEKDSLKIVGLGYTWEDAELAIVNSETLELVGENEVGEICVSGKSIAKCYWNSDEETNKVFDTKINSTDEKYKDKTFLRTEDLGFVYDGFLYMTGRLKDLIIIRGNSYYPQHIEQTTEKSHESFRLGNCSAFSIDEDNEEKLVIIQEIKKDMSISNFDDLVNLVRKNVTETHAISPYKIVFVKTESLPKTSSGKLQRRLSKKMYLNNEFSFLN